MNYKKITAALVFLLMSACGSASTGDSSGPTDGGTPPTGGGNPPVDDDNQFIRDNISSGFGTPSADGTFSGFNVGLSRNEIDSDGNGYSIAIGTQGIGKVAMAGVIPGTDLGAVPTSGTIGYSGSWQVTGMNGFRVIDGELGHLGLPSATGFGMTLRADFNDRTISGGYTNVLVVDGMFDNNGDLGGTVTYQGIEADLDGLVGANEIIGVFHGEAELESFGGRIFAGGFYVDTRPF